MQKVTIRAQWIDAVGPEPYSPYQITHYDAHLTYLGDEEDAIIVRYYPDIDYNLQSIYCGRFVVGLNTDKYPNLDINNTDQFAGGGTYARTPWGAGQTSSDTFNNASAVLSQYIGYDRNMLEMPYIFHAFENYSSCYINNADIFRVEDGNNITCGYAFKNGVFYDTPFDEDNPYTDSEPDDGGGDGDADFHRDSTPERPLPSNFYGDSGLVTLFTPTITELRALANYLWSDNGLDLDQFKKLFNDPFDILLGLNYIPFEVTIAGQKGVNVGNILAVDTGLTMSYPTQENYYFSFGTVNLKEEMKAFCDYAPHSKLSIHLPFIGTQAIDVDVIRNGKYNPYTFTLKYKYNIVNGTVVAYLISSDGVIVYSWCSNVATPIPLAANDYTNTISGLVGLATSAVSGAVTGGMLGGVPGAIGGALIGTATGGANTMASLKPTVTTNGGIGSCAAVLTPTNTAYFILEQPQMQLDDKYKRYNGLPRNVSMKISNTKAMGYNEIEGIRLEVNRATQSEKQEIEQILKSGYIYGDTDGHVISKPTLPSQTPAQIALYQTTSSNNRIDKKCKHLHTYSNIIMKEGTSITNPVVTLCASNQNVTIANYAYIPDFHRFYYVEDVVNVGGARFDEANQIDLYMWEIHLKCDVLMSHRNDIVDQTAIFKRSQKGYNLYLNDDRIQIDNRPHIYTRAFPNTLTNNGTYVLLMAGG